MKLFMDLGGRQIRFGFKSRLFVYPGRVDAIMWVTEAGRST